MTVEVAAYLKLKQRVIDEGYGREVDWAESVLPVESYGVFAEEYIWVVLNSGMRNQVAKVIHERVVSAIKHGQPILSVFKHKGKAAAIERVLTPEGKEWFDQYVKLRTSTAQLRFLQSLPWIGKITKWHLAKNLGMDCAKPDRHLVRIAGSADAAHKMCSEIAAVTGDRVATVDLVIWRAANLGWA